MCVLIVNPSHVFGVRIPTQSESRGCVRIDSQSESYNQPAPTRSWLRSMPTAPAQPDPEPTRRRTAPPPAPRLQPPPAREPQTLPAGPAPGELGGRRREVPGGP